MSHDTPLLNRPLHADMGALVVDRLRSLTPLPAQGFLAGQAVTSTLLALWGDGQRRGPVNDVDVFVPRAADLAMNYPSKSDGRRELPAGAEIRGSGREYFSVIETVSTRQGCLNRIEYAFNDWDPNPPAPLLRLLDDFDFNAVTVGIDLEDGRLTWLPEFEEFVQSGELRLHSLSTPHQTWVRALRKFEDMPWLQGDAHALATHCVAALAAARILGQFSECGDGDRYAAERERLDPGRRYPRLADWPYRKGDDPATAVLNQALPPGWSPQDFDHLDQAHLARARAMAPYAVSRGRARPSVAQTLEYRQRFLRAQAENLPEGLLERLAQRWMNCAYAATDCTLTGSFGAAEEHGVADALAHVHHFDSVWDERLEHFLQYLAFENTRNFAHSVRAARQARSVLDELNLPGPTP